MNELFSLKGKSVLVVGASSGIGKHAAKLFAERGAHLLLAARRKPLLDSLASEIGAKSFYVDVTQSNTITTLLEQIGTIDVLLNTTGINVRKPALEHTEEDWDRLMATNLKGAWSLNQAVIKHMVSHKTKGKLINMGSIYGTVTCKDYALYATSKAGIEHLTRSLALESAPYGIHVNAIAPGYIETELNRDYLKNVIGSLVIERTPLGRMGNLKDLDGVLLLLASNASDYITGSTINVDGGCSTHRF
jgi:NAD(P)-dependent dehydrogenase (short-subunit alcohol dehydrogenase family)